MSSELHVFSGGLAAVGRGASAMGPTMDEGWLAFAGVPFGEGAAEEPLTSVLESSLSFVLCSEGGGLLGLVMVMADLVTVRDAIALARARWWGDRDARII